VQAILSYNESASLFKDPTDTNAIRPIGIGVAWRRIATAHAVSVSKDKIASYLLPTQFAIGINGGIDLITHTMQIQADRYLSRNTSNTLPPTRAILMLDLANMFNSISMARARELIYLHFPFLLPLFDALYFYPSKCWYRDEQGNRASFDRQEGSSQGCPFAALLACLVMHDIVAPLNKELQARALQRKQNGMLDDDGMGSQAIVMSYIDDCTISIPYVDLKYFTNEFHKKGAPLGCILKMTKCKLITTTTGSSPLGHLPQHLENDAHHVLITYCGGVEKGEETHGARILGVPIGNTNFVQIYQQKTLQKVRKAINSIQTLIPEHPQIATALFKFSIQHYTNHLIANDILHNDSLISHSKQYKTQFSCTVNSITQTFLAQLFMDPEAESPSLPPHAWCVASTPIGMGGMGFEDIHVKASKTYITPFARIIRSTQHGIFPQKVVSPDIEEPTQPILNLGASIKSSFKSWRTSNLPVFQKYRTLAHQYLQDVEVSTMNKTSNVLVDYTLHGSLAATNKQVQRSIIISRLQSLWPHLSPSIRKHLPSTMSILTSIPMGAVSRTDPSNRFSYNEFKIYAQRKLRLPLFPNVPKCACGKEVDVYGDHLYSCTNKIDLHNRVRDAICVICKNMMPIVSDVGKENIILEQAHIFDQAPQMRPGDVVIQHPLNSHSEPHGATLIDITVIPPYKDESSSLSFLDIAKTSDTHHMKHEYKKFKLKDHIHSGTTADMLAQEALTKKYRMLPFTIDHNGMLGPIANEFLFRSKKDSTPDKCAYSNAQTTIPIKKLITSAFHKHRHKNILTKADKCWKDLYEDKWYTNTYQAKLPSQWAKQVLGMTFSLHSAKHILRAINLSHTKNISTSQPQKSKTSIQCCSMNLHTPAKYVTRSLRHSLREIL